MIEGKAIQLHPLACCLLYTSDMVLGLYYITKLRKGAKGEGLTFYGPEEAMIAYNEGKCDIHAPVSYTHLVNQRVNFASTKNPLEYPDFLEVQLKSFKDFLQLDLSLIHI